MKKTPPSVLVLFDFDGTITSKDSMFEFIRYALGKWGLFTAIFTNLPYLLGFRLGLISNQQAKIRLLSTCFKGWSKERLLQTGKSFSLEIIPALLRPQALERINYHKSEGHKIVIVSASLDIWLQEWVRYMGVELISSQADFSERIFTGKLKGSNCNGLEKEIRISSAFQLDQFNKIIAYGDTEGDREMLNLADEPYYKPFREKSRG